MKFTKLDYCQYLLSSQINYTNPETGQFWVIDYRIYDPDGDGKSKLEHVADMLQSLIYHKNLPFRTVLMDSW